MHLYVCRERLALIAVAVISTSSTMIAGAICQPPVCFYQPQKATSLIFFFLPLSQTLFVCKCECVHVVGKKKIWIVFYFVLCVFYATSVWMCFLENHTTPLQNVFIFSRLLDKEKSV